MKKYVRILIKLWHCASLDRAVTVAKQFIANGWLPKTFIIQPNFAVVLDGVWCFVNWDGEDLTVYPYDMLPSDDYVKYMYIELSNEARWLIDSIKLHYSTAKANERKRLNELGAVCLITRYDPIEKDEYMWKVETDMRLLRIWFKKHKKGGDWFYEDMRFRFCFPGSYRGTASELRYCDEVANRETIVNPVIEYNNDDLPF